ncbi:MAG TPA: ATP-binding cassette domain-containing protein [Gemmatimonadales bacterium]
MPALELVGIQRKFGSVHALRGADFTLLPGEVHALLGENGAGKTTLMQIAGGLVHPDAGEVRVEGVPHARLSPRLARGLGIGMVHQHFTSVPALTVAENVALAARWPVAPAALRLRVRETSARVGLPLDPDTRVEQLSVGLRQRLEIVKTLASDVRILLLDEPTAVLAPREVEDLVRVIRRFTAAGGSAVLITHKLDEALAAADRVTVLRRGRAVLTARVGETTAAALTAAMIGEADVDEPPAPAAGAARALGDTVVRLEDVEVARESGLGIALRGASVTVAAGEIIGVAAVEGNGQRELLRTIAGRLRPVRGFRQVREPVAFIPEDRTTEGLIPEMTITENIVLGSSGSEPWLRGPTVDWRVAEAWTAGLMEDLAVAAPGPWVPAASLSGGNQQRVVAGRELSRRPAVVVAENPTRGLDIRATAAIHGRLRRAASEGAAVVFHSSDLDEVIGLATRILVATKGQLIEAPAAATRDALGALMLAGG